MNYSETTKECCGDISSAVRTYKYDNGEVQRVQTVRLNNWDSVDFLRPAYSPKAFEQFCNIYRNFLIPAAPIVFGRNILYHVGDGEERETRRILEEGVKLTRRGPKFKTKEAEELWNRLKAEGCLQTVSGRLPFTKLISVGSDAGFLSESTDPGGAGAPGASDCGSATSGLKVGTVLANTSFFIMDPFDCATCYDRVGAPIGLAVKDGRVLNPPLFDRETFIVNADGTIGVRPVRLAELTVCIAGSEYCAGERTASGVKRVKLFERPSYKKTPGLKAGEQDIVIVGTKVVDVVTSGRTDVPGSGFVLRVPVAGAGNGRHVGNNAGTRAGNNAGTGVGECSGIAAGDEVTYHGLEHVRFAIQVGNSVMRDGVRTKGFISKFCSVKKFWQTTYPPSLYPLDFEGARAARMAVGADREGRPMLVWAEGKGKLHYTAGVDSCGASLSELGAICEDLGMYNGVGLDGGGSAQILFGGHRSLMISDRRPEDNSSAERAVPMGLVIG